MGFRFLSLFAVISPVSFSLRLPPTCPSAYAHPSSTPASAGTTWMLALLSSSPRSGMCFSPVVQVSFFLCRTEVTKSTCLIVGRRGTGRLSEARSAYLTVTFSCLTLGQRVCTLCSILYHCLPVTKLAHPPAVLTLVPTLDSPHRSSVRGRRGTVQVRRKE